MLLSNTPLRVIANPFAAPLAADGRACALVQTDPEHPSAEQYVGAQVAVGVKRARRGNPYGDKAFARVAKYDLEPRPLDDTPYHRAKIRSGEVFAADDSTARRCGVSAAALSAAALSAVTAAAAKAAAALPDVDVTKAWQEQGLGAFVEIAKQAQQKARAQREARIERAAAEQREPAQKAQADGHEKPAGGDR